MDVLQVGQAQTFGIQVPPVIEADAQARVRRYAEQAAGAGRLAARREEGADGPGWFCPPTVVDGPTPTVTPKRARACSGAPLSMLCNALFVKARTP